MIWHLIWKGQSTKPTVITLSHTQMFKTVATKYFHYFFCLIHWVPNDLLVFESWKKYLYLRYTPINYQRRIWRSSVFGTGENRKFGKAQSKRDVRLCEQCVSFTSLCISTRNNDNFYGTFFSFKINTAYKRSSILLPDVLLFCQCTAANSS